MYLSASRASGLRQCEFAQIWANMQDKTYRMRLGVQVAKSFTSETSFSEAGVVRLESDLAAPIRLL